MSPHISAEITVGATVSVEGGVACEERLVNKQKIYSWSKCTTALTIMSSDSMPITSSCLAITVVYYITYYQIRKNLFLT